MFVLFVGLMYFYLQERMLMRSQLKIKIVSVPADNMPNYVKGAFISMEDERFYKHHGFDLKGTTRALFSTIIDRDVLA